MSKFLRVQLVCGAAVALWAAGAAHGATDGHPSAPVPAAAASAPGRKGSEDVLAHFKGGQITLADMQAAIANKDPRTRHRLATSEGRLAFLKDLENYDLLVLEAERRGYRTHPAVIHAARNVAVDQMLNEDLKVDPASIPAADVAREAETPHARNAKMSRSAIEGKLRKELAQRRFEQAQDELAKRLYDEHKPEVHADLLEAVALQPTAPPDQPQGFPAAPPDPRAPVRVVQSDGF